ncbi:hypothetical protein Bra5_PD00527 (plasmid) [Rhizobium phaseoli Brasil 5]|nr:hypothetical protein Bra5_PD00527 [Rhizobium phaseoli Brasil 5]
MNALRAALPAAVRAGTVDRFQGQEAPICLVSMTTSSGEELPRDISFLFSLNRINVAVRMRLRFKGPDSSGADRMVFHGSLPRTVASTVDRQLAASLQVALLDRSAQDRVVH